MIKKLILATAAAAFVLGTGFANAEDTKQSSPTQKTPTQQQMDTQATGGAKAGAKMQTPAGTTGAAAQGSSTTPGMGNSGLAGKPTDNAKDGTNSK